MKTCQNCYNSFMCMKYNKEKFEKYKECEEGCSQWENDQDDYDDE